MPDPFSDVRYQPYWWQDAPRPPLADSGPLPGRVDVAVVGSGFTGLSAALTLARHGREVAVLEAGEIGFGASTRNGGQVGPGNQHHDVEEMCGHYGVKLARAMMAEGAVMVEYLRGLVADLEIDCDLVACGRFRGAMTTTHYDEMARRAQALKRFIGTDFHMVSAASQHQEIGSDYYHGGMVLPGDLSVHPAKLHDGLRTGCENSGVLLYGGTAVDAVDAGRGEIRIATNRGTLRARDCVIATNGYSTTPGWLTGAVLRLDSDIIATGELDADLARQLNPNGRVMGESRRVFHYFRLSPDGRRLLMGGRGRAGQANTATRYRGLYRDMVEIFPQLGQVGLSHCWTGQIAYTVDVQPHLGKRDGIHYAGGYCGSGVSRANYFGHKIALKLLGRPDGATPFDDLPLRRFPPLARLPGATGLGIAWRRFLDHRDLRRRL